MMLIFFQLFFLFEVYFSSSFFRSPCSVCAFDMNKPHRLFWIFKWMMTMVTTVMMVLVVMVVACALQTREQKRFAISSSFQWRMLPVLPQLKPNNEALLRGFTVPNPIAITKQNQTTTMVKINRRREYVIFMALEQSKHCGC